MLRTNFPPIKNQNYCEHNHVMKAKNYNWEIRNYNLVLKHPIDTHHEIIKTHLVHFVINKWVDFDCVE
jgi:hypothetical protein